MKKIKNAIKNFIRNIVFDVVKEFQENVFTEYKFIENGKEVFRSEMHIKPQTGDTILIDDSLDSGKWFKFVVKEIEYSQTGFTGNIIGTCIDLKEENGGLHNASDIQCATFKKGNSCIDCGCMLPDEFDFIKCFGCQ